MAASTGEGVGCRELAAEVTEWVVEMVGCVSSSVSEVQVQRPSQV